MSWCMDLRRNGAGRPEVDLLSRDLILQSWDCVCFMDGMFNFLYWRCAYAMDFVFRFKSLYFRSVPDLTDFHPKKLNYQSHDTFIRSSLE